MSDTDDTDFLLFIPPDFFVIRSPECLSPVNYHSKWAESGGSISDWKAGTENSRFLSTYINMEAASTPFSSKFPFHSHSTILSSQRNGSNELLSLQALESSAREKLRTNPCNTWPTKMNDLDVNKSLTGDLIHSSGLTNSVKEDCTKIVNLTENPPSNYIAGDGSKFNLSQVDQLLNDMEKTRAEIKNKLQSNKNKIYEMRKEYSSGNVNVDFNYKNLKSSYNSKSVSEFLKPFEELRESVDSANSPKKQLNKDANFVLPKDPKNLLQLSKIMSKENDVETLHQKLEAEILKKKHCEEIIQRLQLDLLEQQQNLSVAQKIDAEKEEVIEQLRQAWLQLVDHWRELEHQRQELALMLEEERTEGRNANTTFHQKIEMLENRLHETISLAAGYREKNEELEKSLKQLQESMLEFEENFKKCEEYNRLIETEKINVTKQLQHINEELDNEKKKGLKLETRLLEQENQISKLTFEKNTLVEKLREEKNVVDNQKTEINKLRESYNQACNAEIIMTKEVNAMKEEIVKTRNSLKEFYQNQLNIMLKDKVEEFQKEVRKAQSTWNQELQKQEKLSNERLQAEIKQLQDSYKLELSEERRINQKHVNILKSELREGRKKIHDLENRLQSERCKIDRTKRAHSSPKNQWGVIADGASENDDVFKNSSSNANEKFVEDERCYEDEFSEKDVSVVEPKRISHDLKKYIAMLLEEERGNSVDNYKNLEILLSQDVNEFSDKHSGVTQKNSDNHRKKPPWK